ncbi:MAG: hypothetical protein KF696_06825 [Planctomycetes bacterium]|nr:hypothetical protein [Planctomycetota bacterium]MCW8135269.1 hypothetical protein [Planctomycetota bacterium]
MKLTPRFLPEFWEDVADRYVWCESRRPGLSTRFAQCLDDAVARILRFPGASGRVQGGVRRVVLRPFKDLLVYQFTKADLFFIGVVPCSSSALYTEAVTFRLG